MIDMDRAAVGKIVLGIVAALAWGAVMAEEPEFVLGGKFTGSQNSRNRNRELSSITLNRSGMNSGHILLLNSTIGN